MQEPSEEKINKWCEFIQQYLYDYDFINFMNAGTYTGDDFKFMLRTKDKQKKYLIAMFDNLDIFGNSREIKSMLYLVDIEEIKNFNEYMNFEGDKNLPDYKNMQSHVCSLLEKPESNNKFKKMTNREYLKWRLENINDEKKPISVKAWRLENINDEKKPISVKATIGLAFSSLVGVYWFFTTKTKPSIKISVGILNLLVVAALVCAVVLNLSIYFLLPAAIVYGLFAIADCIHVGLSRFYNHAKNQEFINTYDEIMDYLNYETLPESIIDNKGKEIVNELENQNEDIDKPIDDFLNWLK